MSHRTAMGTGRDSYIRLGRPGWKPAVHNINERRDNLPDNVFSYLKEKAEKEQFEWISQQERQERVRAELLTATKSGKRIVPADDGLAEEASGLEAMRVSAVRHEQLKALYMREMQQWSAELAAKGFAILPAQ